MILSLNCPSLFLFGNLPTVKHIFWAAKLRRAKPVVADPAGWDLVIAPYAG